MMPLSPQCEAGCLSFDGGEVKHNRNCVHYPESLTKLWHDIEAEDQAVIVRLRHALTLAEHDQVDLLGECRAHQERTTDFREKELRIMRADAVAARLKITRNALKKREGFIG